MSDWTFTKDGWDPSSDGEVFAEGVIVMSMMTGHGDIRKIWNAANADEVEDARRSWNHLVKEMKYLAFRVNPDDNTQGERMTEFEASAGKIIFVPPVAGGI